MLLCLFRNPKRTSYVLDPKMPVAHYPRPLPSLRVDTQLNAGGGGEDQKESREGVGEEKLVGDISLIDPFFHQLLRWSP